MDVSSRYGSKIAQLALWLVMGITLPAVCNAQQKHALMIGISNYYTNGYKVWENIHGAEDVALLTPVLKEKGFAVQSLTNEDATYEGIVHALANIIGSCKQGDVVYLHFSCHGQPVEDGLNGRAKDEEDGWDEAIVPIDAGREYDNVYKGEKHLTDDELNGYFTKLRKKIGPTGMLYVAMDACHAGTTSRGGLETVRGTKEGLSKNGTKYNPPSDNTRHYSVERTPDMAPALFIEACQPSERNTEIRINGKDYGALSYNIWQALRAMPTLGKDSKTLLWLSIKASTQEAGRWPRTQTLVREE